MGGPTIWIVLGGLIGVVVIFLVVTTTLDRKKNRKLKVEKTKLDSEVKESGTKIAQEITKIVDNNNIMLKNFVPSIGKLKMSDINSIAKKELQDIQKSRTFKLIQHNKEEYDKFKKNLDTLIKNKSNNWLKNNEQGISFFKNYKFKDPTPPKSKKEAKKKSKKDAKKEIKKSDN
ncbi:MHJ_0274 family protein [Candidatus Mycoplasma mahonii]|uniref:MHJ_0274 family protein n=1 Tax=Candidatus Mycoplasma mahonii TaxID=3004105 RepID=UPI0026ED6626|nr:hypothetical protein [Candidatus Mycoplasma mahonii]WKX02793.1 hypothetical protein O3I44_01825 [Candidatus Mycoplasma mahonii]